MLVCLVHEIGERLRAPVMLSNEPEQRIRFAAL